MSDASALKRLRLLVKEVFAETPAAVEKRKAATERRLRTFAKDADPVGYAEAQFTLACCYVLRRDRRVKGHQLNNAERHFELALGALAAPEHAAMRGEVQLLLAFAYRRIRATRGIQDRTTERVYEWLNGAFVSFQRAARFGDSARAAAALTEVCLEDGDVARASQSLDTAISLAIGSPRSNAAAFNRLLKLKELLADASSGQIIVEQDRAGAAAAQKAVAELEPRLAHIPLSLVEEMVGYLDPRVVELEQSYSVRAFMQRRRRRGMAYLIEPPPDPDLALFAGFDNVRGADLLAFAHAFRDARTSPLGYAIVPVYFATDRLRTASHALEDYFANGRRPGTRPSLSYGIAWVSIPRDHRMGLVEAPKLWHLERKPRPEKHVMLLSLTSHNEREFLKDVDSALTAEGNGTALLFVHGYKVTFADAVTRAAQIAYDLNFAGVPIAYSWPSYGELKRYAADEASAEAAVSILAGLLQSLIATKHLSQLHVVCHSMGARVVARAVSALDPRGKLRRPALNEVVFAAPDIDAQEFRQKIGTIRPHCDRMTLYASSKDLALAASRKLHDFPRAGESGPHIVVVPDLLDTVDATDVDTNLIGHSYYGDSSSIIADIYTLVNERKAPPRFRLRPEESSNGRYWRFQP